MPAATIASVWSCVELLCRREGGTREREYREVIRGVYSDEKTRHGGGNDLLRGDVEVGPLMHNLENLRKQAKQYVRWHRERRWTVAEVIRNTLPRYAQQSDVEILDGEFRLADAQEIVARGVGFESWAALVAACRAQPASARRAPGDAQSARLLVVRPFVFVRFVRSALPYYLDTLGFTLAFAYGEPPFYAEVERDGVRLCLRYTREPLTEAARARQDDVVLASFEVTDARALYAELQERGAIFSQTLRVEPFGGRRFVVDDPDGNRILFFDVYGVKGEHHLQDVEGRTLTPG
jgi:uncharacterized glyoxalase superfamily protein PhnB